jgi:hypothetical protein
MFGKPVFGTWTVSVQTTDYQWIRVTHWRAGFWRLTLLAICLGASLGRVLSAAEPRVMVTNFIGPTQGDTRVLRDGDGRVAQPVVAARHVWAIRLQWVTQTPGFACCC